MLASAVINEVFRMASHAPLMFQRVALEDHNIGPINVKKGTLVSAGSRNCIGQHLALNEIKIIAAIFLERFDYEIPKDYKLRMIIKFLYELYNDISFILLHDIYFEDYRHLFIIHLL